MTGGHIARQMVGIILKDDDSDIARFRSYVDHVVKERARADPAWRDFYEVARTLAR